MSVKLGGVQERTQNELTVWAGDGHAELRGAGGVRLAWLGAEQAEVLAQVLKRAPEDGGDFAGLIVRPSGDLLQVRDGQGNLISCLGRRAAREIAACLSKFCQSEAADAGARGSIRGR